MARNTEIGRDYVILNSRNDIIVEKEKHSSKIHLIELNFNEPKEEDLKAVVETFPETRRYVISNYVRFYNNQFKRYKDKKFYVMNQKGDNLLIFLKRNNKVLLDFTALKDIEKEIIFNDIRTILDYIEVVKIDKNDFKNYEKSFKTWKGNVIVMEE